MLTNMYQHAACGIYYGSGNSTEAVRAEIVERLDGLFELLDNVGKSAKPIH